VRGREGVREGVRERGSEAGVCVCERECVCGC